MSAEQLKPVAAWQADNLRLTIFRTPSKSSEIWQDFTGESPEEKTVLAKADTVREQGPYKGGRLTSEVRPDRIDVVYGADPESDSAIPFIGPCEAVYEGFAEACARWLDTPRCDARRIALGSGLVLPVPGREAGYRQLTPYLPFDLDPATHDFLYQINHRCFSSVLSELQLNRLSRWSVVQSYATFVPVFPGGGSPYVSGEAVSACRADLDVNTTGERTAPLPSAKLSDLVRELTSLSREIMSKGLRP